MVWLEGLDRVGLDRRFRDRVEKWAARRGLWSAMGSRPLSQFLEL